MKIIVCPDSFKGSLSSVEAASAIERGLRSGGGSSEIEVIVIPIADGGEGTVDALVRATGGEVHYVRVHDPLLREVDARYGILGGGRAAAVEMAAASGLYLLAEQERNPLITSTYGTGELLLAATREGVEKIVVGIGGSATNDGGTGAMSALGVRFLDAEDRDLPPGGAVLSRLARVDMDGFIFPIDRIGVEVACDVTNPLCGPLGASAVFGPQKGADREMVELLDAALARYAGILKRDIGVDIIDTPGAGAAGGLGAALAVFLKAKLRSGIDMVLDAASFDEAVMNADLVITGEGRIDEQTAYGKAIGGVLVRASKAGVPVAAIAGSVSGDIDKLREAGLSSIYAISSGVSLDYAMLHAAELAEAAAAKLMQDYQAQERRKPE